MIKQLQKKLLGKDTYDEQMIEALKRYIREQQEENKELEQEIKDLNDSITWYQNRFNAVSRDNSKLRERIDKAIEYINQLQFAFDFDKDVKRFAFDFLYTDEGEKLLDILKGSNK